MFVVCLGSDIDFCVYFLLILISSVDSNDCFEKLFSEMTCCVSNWTLHSTNCKLMSAHSSRHLQSVSSSLLAVPHTQTNYGDRSFAVYGARVWNSLPDELRSPDITLITN